MPASRETAAEVVRVYLGGNISIRTVVAIVGGISEEEAFRILTEAGVKRNRVGGLRVYLSPEREQQMVQAYLDGVSMAALVRPGVSIKAVRRLLIRNQVVPRKTSRSSKMMPAGNRKDFTTATEDQIITMYLTGMPMLEVSKHFATSEGKVREILHKREVLIRSRGAPKGSSFNRILTDTQEQELLARRARGESFAESMARFGISSGTYYRVLHRHGLPDSVDP